MKAKKFNAGIDTINDVNASPRHRNTAIVRLAVNAENLSAAQLRQVIETLQIAALDEETGVAKRAIQALCYIEPPEIVTILQTELQENDDAYIRFLVALELYRFFRDRVDREVIARVAQSDLDEDVRTVTSWILGHSRNVKQIQNMVITL